MGRCHLKFDWLNFTTQNLETQNVTNERSAQQNETTEQDVDNMGEIDVEKESDRVGNEAKGFERLNLTPPENVVVTSEGVKIVSDIPTKDVTPLDKIDMDSASPAANTTAALGVGAANEVCSEVNQNTSSSKIDQSLKVRHRILLVHLDVLLLRPQTNTTPLGGPFQAFGPQGEVHLDGLYFVNYVMNISSASWYCSNCGLILPFYNMRTPVRLCLPVAQESTKSLNTVSFKRKDIWNN